MKQEALFIGLMVVSCALPAAAQEHTLRGSREKMERQHSAADSSGYSFLQTASDVQEYADLGVLVPVEESDDVLLKKVSFAVTRPEVRMFVRRLGRQYHGACGQPMVVTSLTRPIDDQPDNASELSVHPAGMAVDIGRASKRGCRRWLERKLLALQDEGVVEATKERHPAHYHVAVYPQKYMALLDAQGGPGDDADPATPASADAAADAPAPRSLASADLQAAERATGGSRRRRGHHTLAAVEVRKHAATYRVQRGDTLRRIAARHGVSVAVLKRANGIRGSRIAAGQVLRIPVTG